MYDFFLVVTNRSSGGPKHLVADVYVNRKATNNSNSLDWFSFGTSNQIGRLSLYSWDRGWLADLKGADGKRYKAVFANEPGIDTIREALADIVNRSSRLTNLALAPESE